MNQYIYTYTHKQYIHTHIHIHIYTYLHIYSPLVGKVLNLIFQYQFMVWILVKFCLPDKLSDEEYHRVKKQSTLQCYDVSYVVLPHYWVYGNIFEPLPYVTCPSCCKLVNNSILFDWILSKLFTSVFHVYI